MQLERFVVILRRAAFGAAVGGVLVAGAFGGTFGEGARADASQPKMWTGRWVELRMADDHPKRTEGERFAEAQKQRWSEAQALVEKDGVSALASMLRRELAEYRVDKQVQGMDFAHASVELLGLTACAAWQTEYPGRWDLLVDLRLEFGKLCVEAGTPELFTEAYADSVLVPSEFFVDPYELVPASAELLAQDEAALAALRLAAFRASLESPQQLQAEPGAAPAPGIEEAVREALATCNAGLIQELGARAVPVLEAILRGSPEELPPQADCDALRLLLGIRELRGAQLILELWGSAGFLFKKRVIRAMEDANVLTDEGTWLFSRSGSAMTLTDQPPTLVEAQWLEVLARLAADSEVGRDSMGLVSQIAKFDGLDERLQRAMILLLDSEDPDAASAVMRALQEGWGRASVVPVLEHGLKHRLAEIQSGAARGLAVYPRNDTLRALASHPHRDVRLEVARSLTGLTGKAVYREQDKSATWWGPDNGNPVPRSVDNRDAACLARLLTDADVEVRELAVKVLFEHPELSIPADLLSGLVRDSSATMRGSLANWRRGQPADPALLEVLAGDSDPNVLQEVDGRLNDLASAHPDRPNETLWEDAYLPALLARLRNPNKKSGAHSAVSAAGRTAAGASAVMATAAASVNPNVLEAVVKSMRQSLSANPNDSAWHEARPADVLAFVHAVWEPPVASFGLKEPLWTVLRSWSADRVRPLRAILADDSAPSDLRFCAAQWTARDADAAWRRDLMEVLTALEPENQREPSLSQVAQAIASRLPAGEMEPLLAELIQSQGAPDGLVGLLGSEVAKRTSMSPAVATETLQRFGDRSGGMWGPFLAAALGSIQPTDEAPQTELLTKLMTNSEIRDEVFNAIGRSHLAAHLPLLENCLTGQGPGDGGNRVHQQMAAAGALGAYLSDEAAEILLKGLGASTSGNLREACFAALDTIRRYQDEKERWAQRKSSKAMQDAAIAELALLLIDRDANVRAQAARSLGALGAVELLPKLVNMLKDPAPEVRGAAQSAIDVLTTQKPAPPEDKKD